MALILIITMFIIIRIYLLTNVIAYDSNATCLFSFHARVYKCACVIKFHVAPLMNTLMKIASNSRSNLCSRRDSLLS